MALTGKTVSYQDIARRIRSRLISQRLNRKLSLNQAAALSGFSRNGLEKIETGDVQPTLETLLKLTEFYGESLPQFFEALYQEAGYAQEVRAELNRRAVEDDEGHRLFLELSQRLGIIEYLDDVKKLKALDGAQPEVLAAVRQLLDTLAPKRLPPSHPL